LMHLLPAYLFAEWRSARVAAAFPPDACGLMVFESLRGGDIAAAGALLQRLLGETGEMGLRVIA